jgi:large subunit ribosomal protein L9
MKVILTNKVKTLGNVGDVVNVSQGYARNFLIPKQFAMIADESNTKQMADFQKRLSKKVDLEKAQAQEVATKVAATPVTIVKKVGGNGNLFGTVTNTEVSKALEEKGLSIERRLIIIDTPIKTLGSYEVPVKLFKGVETIVKINVEVDPAQAAELEKRAAEAAARKEAQEKREAIAKAQASENSEDSEVEADADATEAAVDTKA